MPLYEYRCRNCNSCFEALVRAGAAPTCPGCQSSDLEKLLSAFSVDSAGTRAMAVKSGRRRLAAMERDKAAERREVIEKHDH